MEKISRLTMESDKDKKPDIALVEININYKEEKVSCPGPELNR